MKFTKTSITLAIGTLAALAALTSTPALAQGSSGWYAGGNIGRTGAKIDDERITRGLAMQGLSVTSIEDRDHDTGYKVFGGYQFHPNFAVEAGYFDLGKFGYTARTAPAGSLSGDLRVKGVNLDLVGMYPLTDRLSLLGRVGVTSARTAGAFSATGAVRLPYASANPHERATNAKAGIGMMYEFTPSLAMRVEAERYRINDTVGNKGNVDMVSVGLIYRFGANAQPVRAAAAPYVAPAPAPAPIYVAPPAPPAPAPAPVVSAPPPPPPAPAPYVEPRTPKQSRN